MDSTNFAICVACGSQFGGEEKPTNCKICDDPRQYIPPTGQSWTTLSDIRRKHKSIWTQDPVDSEVWYITVEPKFGIGERACLIQTPNGNVLWDLISLLDQDTIDKINAKGGLKAMVISHPHYYTTYAEWAKTFNCPVWVGGDDREWFCREPPNGVSLSLIDGPAGSAATIVPGVTAIKTGGHFNGSLVLHYKELLFIADTIMTVPSAYTPHPRPKGQTSYSFMWSIPNMIPLAAPEILKIWRAIEPYEFNTTHGAFLGMSVRGKDVKRRVLESMQIQAKYEGWPNHELLRLELPA